MAIKVVNADLTVSDVAQKAVNYVTKNNDYTLLPDYASSYEVPWANNRFVATEPCVLYGLFSTTGTADLYLNGVRLAMASASLSFNSSVYTVLTEGDVVSKDGTELNVAMQIAPLNQVPVNPTITSVLATPDYNNTIDIALTYGQSYTFTEDGYIWGSFVSTNGHKVLLIDGVNICVSTHNSYNGTLSNYVKKGQTIYLGGDSGTLTYPIRFSTLTSPSASSYENIIDKITPNYDNEILIPIATGQYFTVPYNGILLAAIGGTNSVQISVTPTGTNVFYFTNSSATGVTTTLPVKKGQRFYCKSTSISNIAIYPYIQQ